MHDWFCQNWANWTNLTKEGLIKEKLDCVKEKAFEKNLTFNCQRTAWGLTAHKYKNNPIARTWKIRRVKRTLLWEVTFKRELFFCWYHLQHSLQQLRNRMTKCLATEYWIQKYNRSTIPSEIKLVKDCFVFLFKKIKQCSLIEMIRFLWRTFIFAPMSKYHIQSIPMNIIALTKMKCLYISTVTSVRVIVPNDTQRNCKINVYDYILRLLLSSFRHKTRQGSPPTMGPFVILNCKNQEE